jgi:hypothetical protein
VWRVFVGLLVACWIAAAFFAVKALAAELPRHTSLWPKKGMELTRYYPDRESVNRFCNPDDPRVFVDACVRQGITHIETPCNYPHEKYARLRCHELIHNVGGLVHYERRGKLVWYASRQIAAR